MKNSSVFHLKAIILFCSLFYRVLGMRSVLGKEWSLDSGLQNALLYRCIGLDLGPGRAWDVSRSCHFKSSLLRQVGLHPSLYSEGLRKRNKSSPLSHECLGMPSLFYSFSFNCLLCINFNNAFEELV